MSKQLACMSGDVRPGGDGGGHATPRVASVRRPRDGADDVFFQVGLHINATTPSSVYCF